MKKKANSRGFTLIEIITVVALLAILSLVGLSFSSSALWRGRNSRRISDLEQIRNALELYRADNSLEGYPDTGDIEGALEAGYMREYPVMGPQGLPYSYVKSPTSSFSYCLCAPMEKGEPGVDFPNSQCTEPATYLPEDYKAYCVTN